MPAPDESAAPAPEGQGSDSGALNTGERSGMSSDARSSTSNSSPSSPMVEVLNLDNVVVEPVLTIEPNQHQPLPMPQDRASALPSRARRAKRLPSPTGGKQLEDPDLSKGSYQQNTPEDDEYAVDFVFGRRWSVAEDRFEYLVKWQDYEHTHDSWEPRSAFISADGGLTLRFVEFIGANPTFDDDHHGADHLDIDVVFQAVLPLGVVVAPQHIPAWTQPEGAYHLANDSLTSASSDSSTDGSAGSAAPPYQEADPPNATSSPTKPELPEVIVGNASVSDVKLNKFADVAADASVTRAHAAQLAAQQAETASIAQAVLQSQHESDMRLLQARASQQLSNIQEVEAAKLSAQAERADICKMQASYVLQSGMKVISTQDGQAMTLQHPGIMIGQPAPELVSVSKQVWNVIDRKYVDAQLQVQSATLRPAVHDDEKFFAVRTPANVAIAEELFPLADIKPASSPYLTVPSVVPPLTVDPPLMYMQEHKLVVRLVDEPYEEQTFSGPITKVLVEACVGKKQFIADLESLTPYTDMHVPRTQPADPPLKRRTLTAPSMMRPVSPSTGRFRKPTLPSPQVAAPTPTKIKVGDLVWNDDLQDEGRITAVQDEFPGAVGVFVCAQFNSAGLRTVHSSTVDLVTATSPRHERMAQHAFSPTARTQFSAQQRSFERASRIQPGDIIDRAVPDPHFRNPDGYATEARRPAWIHTTLSADKHMVLGASVVRFIRSVQASAFLANHGRTPTHTEFMFDLFMNCEASLKKKLMLDGTLDSQAAFEHRLDHLCPANMKRTTASIIAQLLAKVCPNASKLVAWIQIIKEVVLSCVDREVGDVIPTSLGAYDRQVASMQCQFDNHGMHLVLALVTTITHVIEQTMPDDMKSFLIMMPMMFMNVTTLADLDRLETNLTRLAESLHPQKSPKALTMFGNIFAEDVPPSSPESPTVPDVEVPTLQQQAKVAEREEKRALQKARVSARKANTAAGLPPSKLKDFRCNHCVKRHEGGNPCGCADWDHYSVLCPHKPSEDEFKKMVCSDCATHPKWDEKRRGYMSIGHTKGSISCHNRYKDRKAATPGGK